MKLLLTAFDPFGGSSVNPALEAIKLIPDQLDQIQIIKLEIPTVFERSISVINSALETFLPDAVLCIGQAGGRTGLTPERIAININDASIPDNEGNKPVDTPVLADGPAAYFSTLPIKAMVSGMREAGLPASISNSAGTFVCNHLMYGLLHTLATHYPTVKGGFMHVPYVPSQTTNNAAPSMNCQDIARGIEAAIRAIGAYL